MSDPNSSAVANPLSRLPSDLYTLYQERLTFWADRITALEAQLVMLEASPVESYSFSGGEGQQTAKRRDLDQVMGAASHAEKMYGYYWKKVNGYGSVNMTLRRR
jgi:hypothetical protein